MANPQTIQGYLNRILTSVYVTDHPQLNVTASFMSKALSQLTFDDDSVDQIGTATGLVNSPKPYIMAQLVVNILRSQVLPALYYTQMQLLAPIGTVTVYTDSTNLPPFVMQNCSILHVDPGAFDGTDPTTKVTIKGIYLTNNQLWTGAAL
jgi:hypothetical protein